MLRKRFVRRGLILFFALHFMLMLSSCGSQKINRLNEAIDNQNYEEFQKYLDESLDLEEQPFPDFYYAMSELHYQTPLQRACRVGNYQMVKDLVDAGANVNYTDDVAPYSPLMYAVMSSSQENFEIVKFLVEKGASVTYREEEYGDDALWKIILDDSTPNMEQMIDFLVENGADIYYKDNLNSTLLHHAAGKGNTRAIRFLLQNYNFDINATDGNNDSVLIWYCRSVLHLPNEETVSYFLEQGADPTIVNNDGKTAYDYAVERGFVEIAELLK